MIKIDLTLKVHLSFESPSFDYHITFFKLHLWNTEYMWCTVTLSSVN